MRSLRPAILQRSTGPEHIYSNNLNVWDDSEIVEDYAALEDLFPEETVLLQRWEPDFSGKAILDLGVGAGRTTPHLLRLSKNYTGFDFAPGMIRACQERFPGVRFVRGDAREMPMFADAQFDVVMFSFNGLDYLSHTDRLRALREIRRVLKAGGLFLFSSHNSAREPFPSPWKPFLEWVHQRDWPKLLENIAGVRNFMLRRGKQIFTDEYSVRVDNAHSFRLFTYYVTPAQQIQQLETHGFRLVEMYNRKGEAMAPDARETASAWIHYLAQ